MSVFVGRLLLTTALLGTVGSTLRSYPHQLAYFNELSGGPDNGWRHLLGSGFDWGQDVQLHARSMPGCCDVVIMSTKMYSPAHLGIPLNELIGESVQFDSREVLLVSFDVLQANDLDRLVWSSRGLVEIAAVKVAVSSRRLSRNHGATAAFFVPRSGNP